MAVLWVGAGEGYTSLTAAVAAAHRGDTINVRAGTYTNDFPAVIDGLTIQGVGGAVHLVATAAPSSGGAVLDVMGTTTIRGIDVSGIGSGRNVAGLHYEGGNLVVQSSSFENNGNGLVADADPTGTIWIDHSEFTGNGTGTAPTPTIDVGDVARLTITNSYIHDGGEGGEIRSRAEMTVVTDSRVFDNSGLAASSIDLPNGGNAIIERDQLQKGQNSVGNAFITYGEAGSLHVGRSITVANDEFINARPLGFVYLDTPGVAIHSYNDYIYTSWLDASPEQLVGMSADGFEVEYWRPTLSTAAPSTATATDMTASALSATESVSGLTASKTVALSGQVLSVPGSGSSVVYVFDFYQSYLHILGNATIGADGSWRFLATRLNDGDHLFSISVDGPELTAGPDVVVDTTGPTLTIAASGQGKTTAGTSSVVSGTVSDGTSGVATVDVFDWLDGAATDLGTALVGANGAWQLTADHLMVGTHQFEAVASDRAGNTTTSAPIGVFVVATTALTPVILRIVGNRDGGVTLLGTSQPNSLVSVTVNRAGVVQPLGGAITAADGSFRLTSTALLPLTASNTFIASAFGTDGRSGTSTGLFQLSSAGDDTLYGTTGQSDVFATFLRTGQDEIVGFETAKAVGARHDVINLSGTGYGYYAQVAPHISGTSAAIIQLDATRSVTLVGVSAASLTASDFRFS